MSSLSAGGVTGFWLACLLGRLLTQGNPFLKLISTKGKLVIMSDIILFFLNIKG